MLLSCHLTLCFSKSRGVVGNLNTCPVLCSIGIQGMMKETNSKKTAGKEPIGKYCSFFYVGICLLLHEAQREPRG